MRPTVPGSFATRFTNTVSANKKRRRTYLLLGVLSVCATFVWITYQDIFSDAKSRIRKAPVIFVATRNQVGTPDRWSVDSVLKGSQVPKSIVKPGYKLSPSFFPWTHSEPPPDALLVFMGRKFLFTGPFEPDSFMAIYSGHIPAFGMTLSSFSALCPPQ